MVNVVQEGAAKILPSGGDSLQPIATGDPSQSLQPIATGEPPRQGAVPGTAAPSNLPDLLALEHDLCTAPGGIAHPAGSRWLMVIVSNMRQALFYMMLFIGSGSFLMVGTRNMCPTGSPRLPTAGGRRCVACAGARKQIPIFPLNVVALPCATVPLMIFEARYRVLFNTILAGEPGVEEGLVQTESPFCGSRRFGMCYMDGRSGPGGAARMSAVGTTLEVMDFAHVQDGRIFITSKGRGRFRVVSIVRERPILIAEVEELEEDEPEGEEAASLAQEVADLLRSVIRLNVKLNERNVSEDQLEPEELSGLTPRQLSFWVADFFKDVKVLQQNLLEEESTIKRLTLEKDILSDTVRYYSATVALKSLSSSPDSPPPATPDSSSSSGGGSGGTGAGEEGRGQDE